MTSGHWATDQACLGLSWEITEPEATILVTGQKMGSEGRKDNKANGQGKKKKNHTSSSLDQQLCTHGFRYYLASPSSVNWASCHSGFKWNIIEEPLPNCLLNCPRCCHLTTDLFLFVFSLCFTRYTVHSLKAGTMAVVVSAVTPEHSLQWIALNE